MLPVLRCHATGVEAWCYHSTPTLLRRQKAVLPLGRPCYLRWPPVLPSAAAVLPAVVLVLRQAVATGGGCRCCNKPLLPAAAAVLLAVAISATTSREHCYHRLAAVLRVMCGGATRGKRDGGAEEEPAWLLQES